MAASTITKNLRDGLIRFLDGAGTPDTYDVTVDEGNLQWTETQNVIPVLDRGALGHPRLGDDAPVEWQFDVKYTELFDDTTEGTVYEWLRRINNFSATVSTLTTTDVFTFKMRFYVDDPGGGTDELIEFPDCYWTQIRFQEGDQYNRLSLQGQSFAVKPTVSKANP